MASTKKNHQCPPFRAEHLGSLLRPQKLVDKRVALDGKKALVISNDKELHSIEDQGIDETIKEQLALGFHAVNDGEYRRHQFWGTFFPGLEGMEEIVNPPLEMFRLYVPDLAASTEAGHKPGESIVCVGKIKHVGSQYLNEWDYLKARLPVEYVKPTRREMCTYCFEQMWDPF